MAKKEINEFEAARKKRQKKFAAQRTRKFIAVTLILAILSAGIYIFVKEDVAGIIGDRIAASSGGEEGLPIDFSGTTVIDTFAAGEHLGVLTDAVYLLYAENGKQLLSAQHGFANPVVEASGRRFLIYDQGGNKLIVRTRDKVLFEKEFENKIISANISSEGWLCVVTSAKRYASQLHVFDGGYGEEIFTWSSSNEYIVAASADGDGKTVAAAALSANASGEMVTSVHIFTAEAAVELGKREFKGSSVLDLQYDEKGDIKVICDNITACLNKEGKVLGSYVYENIPISSINIAGKNGAVIIFDRFTEARAADAVFLDENLSEIKTVSISGKYICAAGSESSTAVYCSGKTHVFDNMGVQTALLEKEQDAVLLELASGKVFAITRSELCEITG